MEIKGYKAFNKDMTNMYGKKFEVGKTYSVNGKINGIIVKDLSRLGRNYIEVGNFIDEIVPQYGLRFISINDKVDSYLEPNVMDSLEIPFKNLMNESYSKDSSKKMPFIT